MRFEGLAAHRNDVAEVCRAHLPECFQFLGDATIIDREFRRGRKIPVIPIHGSRQIASFLHLADRISDDSTSCVEQQILTILDRALRHCNLGALSGATSRCVTIVECHRPVQTSKCRFEQSIVEIKKWIARTIVDQSLNLATRVAAEIPNGATIQTLDRHALG